MRWSGSLTKEDVEHESVQKASTLYGEVMPAGVVMMLGALPLPFFWGFETNSPL